MKLTTLTLIICIGFGQLNAQTNTFFKTYNLANAYSLDLIPEQGYIITGHNLYLLKTDTLGNTIWTKDYDGVHKDIGYAIQRTYDGGYIVVGQLGESDTLGQLLSNIYIFKTDILGDTIWSTQWNAATGDRAFSVIETLDSNYVVAGVIDAALNWGVPKAFLLKLSNDGDTVWSKIYSNDTGASGAKTVIQTLDGGFIFCGQYGFFNAGEVYLVKTDAFGDTLWTKKGGLGFPYGKGEDIVQSHDSTFIITGSVYNSSSQDMFISKIDQYGNLIWTEQYGGNEDDYASSIDKINNNGFVITGSTYSYSSGQFTNADIWLLRINGNGDTLWTHSYGDSENNEGLSIKTCSDGGFIITGYTGLAQKAFLLKTDSLGNAPFSTFVENVSNKSNKSLKVFPNPAKDRITIEFNIETLSSNMQLIIYNSLGQKVRELGQKIEYGVNVFEIKTDMFEKGLYFLCAHLDNETITKKIIIK